MAQGGEGGEHQAQLRSARRRVRCQRTIRKPPYPRCARGAPYFGPTVTFAARTTFAHLLISDLMNDRNSSGDSL